MSLYEQLEKNESELKKVEEKKKELLEKKKKLLAEIELEEAKKAAEKNREIMDVIQESFGEVNEANIDLFRRVMQNQAEYIQRQKENLCQEQHMQ